LIIYHERGDLVINHFANQLPEKFTKFVNCSR